MISYRKICSMVKVRMHGKEISMKDSQFISKTQCYIVSGILTGVVCILLVFVVLLKKDVTAYENTASIIGTYESNDGVPEYTQYLVFEKHKDGLKCIWYQQGEFQHDGQVTSLKKGIHQIYFDDLNQEFFIYVDREDHINFVAKDFAGSFDKIADHSVYMGKQPS